MQHPIGPVSSIPQGKHRIVKLSGIEIGVFNIKGTFFALRNICPHQGAPLCLGKCSGTALPSKPNEYIWGKEQEIIRCPWHGWEFDIKTGKALFDPTIFVKTYAVHIDNEQIILTT